MKSISFFGRIAHSLASTQNTLLQKLLFFYFLLDCINSASTSHSFLHLTFLILIMSTAPPTSTNEPLSNTLAPSTAATLTIRVIKSFEYRTSKNLILHNVDLTTTTVAQLRQSIIESM